MKGLFDMMSLDALERYTLYCLIFSLAALLIATGCSPSAENGPAEQEQPKAETVSPEKTTADLLDALANVDAIKLSALYADSVLVRRGSEILKDEYGLTKEHSADHSISRAELVAAYDKHFFTKVLESEQADKWRIAFTDPTNQVKTMAASSIDAATASERQIIVLEGYREGDYLVSLKPSDKDDELAWLLRQIEGSWKIVSELTDF